MVPETALRGLFYTEMGLLQSAIKKKTIHYANRMEKTQRKSLLAKLPIAPIKEVTANI